VVKYIFERLFVGPSKKKNIMEVNNH